ncbi:MAG: hypothetical protein WC475_03120 [Candidatus Paceibacterota bacterium]
MTAKDVLKTVLGGLAALYLGGKLLGSGSQPKRFNWGKALFILGVAGAIAYHKYGPEIREYTHRTYCNIEQGVWENSYKKNRKIKELETRVDSCFTVIKKDSVKIVDLKKRDYRKSKRIECYEKTISELETKMKQYCSEDSIIREKLEKHPYYSVEELKDSAKYHAEGDPMELGKLDRETGN